MIERVWFKIVATMWVAKRAPGAPPPPGPAAGPHRERIRTGKAAMIERVWFKIGEAAQRVGATPKELRYWEKVIPELQPRRSKGNLRYYHQDEIIRLQRIRQWLAEGCTVADCRLRLQGLPIASHSEMEPTAISPSRLWTALQALRKVLGRLSGPPGSLSSVETDELLEDLRTHARPKKQRITVDQDRPAVPAAPLLSLEPEASVPTPEDLPEPAAKRTRKPKPKPEASALGRMWSVTRLPLDLDE